MKILILGSEGFIGKVAVKFFKEHYDVFGGDLLEAPTQKYNYSKVSRLSPDFEELLQKTEFDVCLNAAGSGNVNYSMSHPLSDFEANSLDTIRLLDALRRHQPQTKYVHISSGAVYGNPWQLPIREDAELKPISPYGWHKLISEKICQEYSSVFGLRTAILRPFSVYGVGLKKQLFWDLFQKCVNRKPDNAVKLWGTGNESRDFVCVDDLILAIHLIIQKSNFKANTYNVASGEETTIFSAATKFCSIYDPKIIVQFSGDERVGDPQNWRADITSLSSLGFIPTVNLQDGIQKIVVWMQARSKVITF